MDISPYNGLKYLPANRSDMVCGCFCVCVFKNPDRDGAQQKAGLPDKNTSSKGFQLFLNVLNKGVNVATLTKIMTSAKEENRPQALTSPPNTTHTPDRREPEFHQNHRSGDVEFWRMASSEPPRRSLSTPKENFMRDELPVQSRDGDQSYPGFSGSHTHMDKITITPEEEHKHKQAQHILQAIGMNIEFEELGQMSHRIQERLYGKKDSDRGRPGRHSRERDTMRVSSPKLHNRSSSSSRSSYSPSPQKSKNKDSHSFQSTSSEEQFREINSTCPSYPQDFRYTLTEPRPAPAMPAYSPISSPGQPFPAFLPNLSQPTPQFCFPYMPPYPQFPPMNAFPAALAQMRPLFPPPPVRPLNPPQKSKPLSRPRCLQVIETKQPG